MQLRFFCGTMRLVSMETLIEWASPTLFLAILAISFCYSQYFSATQFFDLMSRSKFGRLETHEDDITPYVYSCDLLIIDDIGTEITNSVVSSIFFDCLNQRLNTRRSMILSMNLSISELKKIYSERILSRIMNNFSMLRLFGNDIRLQKRILRTQQGDNNND